MQIKQNFYPNKRKFNKPIVLINENINFPEVLVIDQTGKNIGKLSLNEALSLAQAQEKDLFCIAPNAKPPVCRILDYGKWKYTETKNLKAQRKKQQQIKVKEVRITANIGVHDLQTKANQAIKFFEAGNKVKLSLKFRGREIENKSIGYQRIEEFLNFTNGHCQKEGKIVENNRFLDVLLAPTSNLTKNGISDKDNEHEK